MKTQDDTRPRESIDSRSSELSNPHRTACGGALAVAALYEQCAPHLRVNQPTQGKRVFIAD